MEKKKKETPENSKSIIKPFPGDVKRPQRIRQIDRVAVHKNKPVPACLPACLPACVSPLYLFGPYHPRRPSRSHPLHQSPFPTCPLPLLSLYIYYIYYTFLIHHPSLSLSVSESSV